MKEIQDRLNEGPSMFTEKDYEDLKKYGITDAEIEVLKDANVMVETAKLVPDNTDKFFEKYKKIFANKDGSASMKTFFELAEKDQKFFVQLVSAIELADKVEVEKPAEVQKISLAELDEEQTAQYADEIKELLAAFKKLSPEEQKYVLEKAKK